MSFILLGVAVALVAYAAINVVGTALIAVPLLRAVRLSDPAVRARRLVVLRLLPTVFAVLVVGGLVVPAFLWLEPRDTAESVSWPMAEIASLGLLILLAGPARGFFSVISTRRLMKRWDRVARPFPVTGVALPAFVVDEPFPLVSLVGWFRPRLVVARSVLSSCDRDELAAVLAHEAGHNDRRDPWIRLAVRACPDFLSLTPLADRMEQLWSEAAEQDADERAARTGPTRAMDLASALVKVARLAGAGKPPAAVVSDLYRGDGVAARVRRLLELEQPRNRSAEVWSARPFAGIVLLALLVFFPASAAIGLHHGVHGVLEAVVSFLQ